MALENEWSLQNEWYFNMKALLLGLILVSNLAYAKEEVVTGYGVSFNEAVQNAKIIATEQAANTFISARQEIDHGKLNETIVQYNGGFIKNYEVKKTVINEGSVYEVTIEADVDTDKINTVLEAHTTQVSNKMISDALKIADNEAKYKAAWKKLDDVAGSKLAVVVTNVRYVTQNGNVTVNYELNIVWNPKWYDDAKKLAMAEALPVTAVNAQKAACFKSGYDVECALLPEFPDFNIRDVGDFAMTIHNKDGTTSTQYKKPNDIFLGFTEITNEYVSGSGWFSTYSVASLTFNRDMVSPSMMVKFSIPLEQFRNTREITIGLEKIHRPL